MSSRETYVVDHRVAPLNLKMVNHPDLSRSRMGQAGLNILRGCFAILLDLSSSLSKGLLVQCLEVVYFFKIFCRCFSFVDEVGRPIIWISVFNVAKYMQQVLVGLILVI